MTNNHKFLLPPKLQQVTIHTLNYILGYYVYELLDNGIPFYVGCGKLRRAWNLHNQECEDFKFNAKEFQVRIIYDNLTKDLAQIRKKSLLDQYRREGIYLTNSY